MTYNQAVKTAMTMAKDGYSHEEIAVDLGKSGYKGRRGPLTKLTRGNKDRTEVVRRILGFTMDAEEKIALALLVLG